MMRQRASPSSGGGLISRRMPNRYRNGAGSWQFPESEESQEDTTSNDESPYVAIQIQDYQDQFEMPESRYLPALHVSDHDYHAYIHGTLALKQRQKTSLCGPGGLGCTPTCCSKFCTFFSLVATLFLVMIGILIDCQPLYIQGVLEKEFQFDSDNKITWVYLTNPTKRLPTASTAYKTAAVYCFTCLVSAVYAYNIDYWIRSRLRRRHYRDIPDADSTTPTFHLPSVDSEIPASAYQGSKIIRDKLTAAKLALAARWPRWRKTKGKTSKRN